MPNLPKKITFKNKSTGKSFTLVQRPPTKASTQKNSRLIPIGGYNPGQVAKNNSSSSKKYT